MWFGGSSNTLPLSSGDLYPACWSLNNRKSKCDKSNDVPGLCLALAWSVAFCCPCQAWLYFCLVVSMMNTLHLCHRSREFLWQEGHTAFATKEEADKEVDFPVVCLCQIGFVRSSHQFTIDPKRLQGHTFELLALLVEIFCFPIKVEMRFEDQPDWGYSALLLINHQDQSYSRTIVYNQLVVAKYLPHVSRNRCQKAQSLTIVISGKDIF